MKVLRNKWLLSVAGFILVCAFWNTEEDAKTNTQSTAEKNPTKVVQEKEAFNAEQNSSATDSRSKEKEGKQSNSIHAEQDKSTNSDYQKNLSPNQKFSGQNQPKAQTKQVSTGCSSCKVTDNSHTKGKLIKVEKYYSPDTYPNGKKKKRKCIEMGTYQQPNGKTYKRCHKYMNVK